MEYINLYEELKKLYLNEYNCPELLPYNNSLIQEIENEIIQREDDIENKKTSGKDNEYFLSRILLMSLDRTKYLLSSYLHSRLAKIEKYCIYLLNNKEARKCLSIEEEEYALKYKDLLYEYYNSSVLDKIPESFRDIEEPDMIIKPNLNIHVICKVDEHIGDVEIEQGGTSIHFEKGDVVAVRYKPIRGLVLSHKVSLC